MKKQIFIGSVILSVLVALAFAAQDKYSVKVPGGLAFSEFRGYEDWQVVEGIQGRDSCQWQAFPRWFNDSEDRMGTEKAYGGAFFREGAGHCARAPEVS